jgi:diadenosine tetraphosphatase ApaH/serine/threonine PP2A family protein phosphatase
MTLELDGRRFDLHPEGFHPYRVRADSLVPGGAVWHGELPVGEDELRAGQRVVARLTACGALGCAEVDREITLGRDRTHDPRPICDLRPLTAVR